MIVLSRANINVVPNYMHWTDPMIRPIASAVCIDLMEIDRQALNATISRVVPTKWLHFVVVFIFFTYTNTFAARTENENS